MEKKVQRNFLWVALLVLGTIGILARHNRAIPYRTASGLIFGTVYNITYQYDSDLKSEIEAGEVLTCEEANAEVRKALHG